MPKVNKPGGSHSGTNSKVDAQKQAQAQVQPELPAKPEVTREKQSSKKGKPGIGGTAVQGAKSTQPKELKPTSPAQQQPEYYNRETRRRMQQMGTGPYSQQPTDALRNRKQKRLEKRKERQDEVKKTVVTRGPSTDVRLGRRNTYFMLTIVAIIVLVIVLAIIIRHPF